MFRSLLKLLRIERDEATEKQYGLSPKDIELLRLWRSEDSFAAFARALDIVCKLEAEKMLASRDDAILHETRGTILGLRRAVFLVDEIIQKDAAFRDADAERAERAREQHDGRINALYGTPSYRALSL